MHDTKALVGTSFAESLVRRFAARLEADLEAE